MQKRFKHFSHKLVILSVMGIAINTHLGNFLPQQSFKESKAEKAIYLKSLSLVMTPGLVGARDDRQRECRFLGICDA